MRLVALLALLASTTLVGSGQTSEDYGATLESRRVPDVGPTMAVEAANGRLYAAGRGTLHVLDISRPESPTLLGKLSGLGNTRQIFMQGDTAYITARQDGLWLVDVSDPAKPRIISHYDTVEMATGIWVAGKLAFVATRCYGVEIVDVTDPRKPRHVSTLKTGEAQSCWARGNHLFIGDWAPKKLLVADVSDPASPKVVGEGLLDGYGDGGCLAGKYCFAATGHHSRAKDKARADGHGHGLDIFDVSDPQKPVFVSRVKFPVSYHISNDMWSARTAGGYCVVADTWNGVFVVDTHEVAQPKIVAHAKLPIGPKGEESDPVGGVALGDGVIYAAGIDTGLYVIPVAGMASPVTTEDEGITPKLVSSVARPNNDPAFISYEPDGQVRSVAVVGDVAWTACGAAGIQAIRLGDELKPVSITQGKGEVFHVHVTGDRLYAAESAGGLGIYQIESDLRLRELGRLRLPNQNIKQVVCPAPGKFAMMHCGSSQILIADVSDPAHPKVVLKDAQVGLFYGDQLVPEVLGGRYLVAHWHRSGPAWYDISGDKPVLAGNSPDMRLYSWQDGACAFGDGLLIAKAGKLQVLNPGDMREVSALPAYGIPGMSLAGRPSASGHLLALARRHERLVQLLDVSEVEHPRLLREFHLDGHPGACAFWQGRLVIPAGYRGLLLQRGSDL